MRSIFRFTVSPKEDEGAVRLSSLQIGRAHV